MKQARAFGVGVVLATQNPMDLDYRALGNAGTWCIGRLQTDADRARVIDGLAGSDGALARALAGTVRKLAPRWFVMRDVHAGPKPFLAQPRWAFSWLRGPLTRTELKKARELCRAGGWARVPAVFRTRCVRGRAATAEQERSDLGQEARAPCTVSLRRALHRFGR